MLDEKKSSVKYVVLLFSILALFVIGNLITEFNILDLLYLGCIVVAALRFLKIRMMNE